MNHSKTWCDVTVRQVGAVCFVLLLTVATGSALVMSAVNRSNETRVDTILGLMEHRERAQAARDREEGEAMKQQFASAKAFETKAMSTMEEQSEQSRELAHQAKAIIGDLGQSATALIETTRYSAELYKTIHPGPRMRIVLDENWRIIYMNSMAERMTGLQLVDMRGKSPAPILPADLRGLYEGDEAQLPVAGQDPLILRARPSMGGGFIDWSGNVVPAVVDVHSTEWAQDRRYTLEITPTGVVADHGPSDSIAP